MNTLVYIIRFCARESVAHAQKSMEVEIVNAGLDSSNQLDKSERHGSNPDIQQRDNLGDSGVVDVDNTYAITNNMDRDDESLKSV